MSVTSFVIRLLFLLFPGIIASSLFRILKGRQARKDWEDYLEIGVFALFSYGIYWLISLFLATFLTIPKFSFFDALLDEKIKLNYYEIFAASGAGVILSFASSWMYTHKIINRFGRWIGVTRHYGDDDVWNFFHNLEDKRFEWVLVRDHKVDLVYFGWIDLYSDSEKEREILMRDVQVYSNNTGELLYALSDLYFSRNRYDLTIEIPLADSAALTNNNEGDSSHGKKSRKTSR